MYSACADVGMTIVHPREYNGFRCSRKFARKRAKMVRYVHTAVSSGSWCGGQRQQCGDSGSGLR